MIDVILITAQTCHHCQKARDILRELRSHYVMNIREVDVASREGQELVARFNILASPGIIIDEEIALSGGVSKEELRQYLNKRST